MRARSKLWIVVSVAAVLPPLLMSARATADAPPVAGSAAASESTTPADSASSSAFASGPPAIPPLPRLSAKLASLPEKPTPAPTTWKGAEALAADGGNAGCDVHLVREWLHATCGGGDVIDVSLLSGDANGVSLSMPGEEFNIRGELVVPLRKGKSYIVSVTSAAFGKYSSGLPESAALVWVLWDEGATMPVIRFE